MVRVRNPTPWFVLVNNETSPVGVPEPPLGATETFNVTGDPCVPLIELGTSVVVVALNVTVFHLLKRLVTLTDPRPVARSKPVAAWYFAEAVP